MNVTYSFGMFECLAANTFAFLECLLGDFAFLLELVLEFTSLKHIACTEFNGEQKPLKESAKGYRVLVDLFGLLLVASNQLLEESEFLVSGELCVFASEGVVLGQSLEELSTVLRLTKHHKSCFLPL